MKFLFKLVLWLIILILLALLLDERNEFVHHLLPLVDPTSIENCQIIDEKLEQQREKLLPVIKMLQGMVKSIKDGSEFLMSEEGNKLFGLPILRHEPLVVLLQDIANQAARPDGWVPLSTAGQLLRKFAPDEIATINERYGHKSLKNFILAAGLFDIRDEPTEKGGTRVLYRLKPE